MVKKILPIRALIGLQVATMFTNEEYSVETAIEREIIEIFMDLWFNSFKGTGVIG